MTAATPDPSAGRAARIGRVSPFGTARTHRRSSETGSEDPKVLGEVRGRNVDEASLQRARYRSYMGEIEHLLGPLVKGKRVPVEGRLAGTGRTALERLAAEVEELRLEDEKLAGILFALMYGLRPFFFKMQRPKDD